MDTKSKDPLHGISLKTIVNELVEFYGFEELGRLVKIHCFLEDPSIQSTLKFLRQMPWARTKVEKLYISSKKKMSKGIKDNQEEIKTTTKNVKDNQEEIKTFTKSHNPKDLKIWDDIFANPPVDWRKIEPTDHMIDCIEFLKEQNVKTVIDVGCGPGVWSQVLAKDGFSVSGFDFSQEAIEYATIWAHTESLKIKFKKASVTEVPFVEKFDAAVVSQILENVSKKECDKAIENLHGSVKPKGALFGLFNPYMTDEMLEQVNNSDNPTKGATSINYTDDEVMALFDGKFKLLSKKVYPDGLRLFCFKNQSEV